MARSSLTIGAGVSRAVWWMLILIPAALAGAVPADAEQSLQPGQQLFYGQVDLRARIRTHLVDLPPQVVRCGNCHAVGDGPEVPRSLAPRLTRNLLLEPLARRGGPPSHYDFARFCALLRQGIDPAYVLISVEMPIYSIDDVECRALWAFVTAGGHDADAH